MDEILLSNKGNLLLLTKDKSPALNYFKNKNSIYVYDTYNLSIDDVRAINSKAILKSSIQMTFVIYVYIAGIEAQNAMLKMLEDYTWCQFIFVCESEQTLIPTVRSRLKILNLKSEAFIKEENTKEKETKGKEKIKEEKSFVVDFLKMNTQERLKSKEIIAMMAKEIDTGTKQSAPKQKDDAHRFVVELISHMLRAESPNLQKINELHEISNYILGSGVSAKQMIEYICYRI